MPPNRLAASINGPPRPGNRDGPGSLKYERGSTGEEEGARFR
jgi:hypothetical protein